ncbi:MAG TPA: iron-sulfur cluster assembly accessory protein [Candidatus Eisenbacteria bacterium]
MSEIRTTETDGREASGASSISLTPAAVEFVKRSRAKEGKEGQALRVGVKAGGCSGYNYFIGFTADRRQGDTVLEYDGLTVYVDPRSLEVLAGTEVDYERGLLGKGIQFKNPRVKKTCGCGDSFTI